MQKQFELTQEEYNELIAISKDKTPVMNIGGVWTGMDKQERADEVWKKVGEKQQVDWRTIEPAGTGNKMLHKGTAL